MSWWPFKKKVNSLTTNGKCPICGGGSFLDGPQGAGSRNIECVTCGTDFNIYPDTLPTMIADQIGWNRSGQFKGQKPVGVE